MTQVANDAVVAQSDPVPVEVYVRMYRALGFDAPSRQNSGEPAKPYKGLLGDCFLIRVVQGDQASHIMIDCGVLMGSAYAKERMRAIAADIVRTAGQKLDLLVVTHEHWDHISGFSQAQDILLDNPDFAIGAIWMAWTEKSGDPQVEALRKKFDKTSMALNALAARISAPQDGKASLAGADPGRMLRSLQGFVGELDNAPTQPDARAQIVQEALAAAEPPARKLQAREIMQKLKDTCPPAYLEPGTVLSTPAASGAPVLQAIVLGPPRDEKLLFKDKPSSGPARETYLDSANFLGLVERALAAADENEDPDQNPCSDSPFDGPYCHLKSPKLEAKVAKAKRGEDVGFSPSERWLAEHYYNLTFGRSDPAEDEARIAYRQDFDALQMRRRVDDDWMAAAGPLALKLDSDTNNTSLVLAFDLPDGTAMLFAADAQVGNWESWHTRTYPTHASQGETAEQILNRTRFYKVGHHGSHNATLQAQGLEMMVRPDLVAAIPTDEDFGSQQGGNWKMPNPRVAEALNARAQHRIMRNDERYDAAAASLFGTHPSTGAPRLVDTDLYLEYRVY